MRIRFKPWARPELEASTFYRDNPESLKEYEKLKNDLATLYKDDRKKYTALKAEFISDVIGMAKETFNIK